MRDERKRSTRIDLPPGSDRAADQADALPTEVAAETILAGRREAVLVHNGMRYRLRITSNGKLILTK